jgi:hypothetical protein
LTLAVPVVLVLSLKMVLGLPTVLLTVVSTVLFSPLAVHAADLESVLAGQANLTTFRGLVKVSISMVLPRGPPD